MMNSKLFDYIAASPTAYHAAAHTARLLESRGFKRLNEGERWELERGFGYYTVRNGSSLIAFKVPDGDFSGFMIAASHSDSPCFKIKENPEIAGEAVRLSVEKYGGLICSTWLDRPLSVAGRAAVATENGMECRLVDIKEPCALIPNTAIHMNRKVNEGYAFNLAVDMLPLYGGAENTFKARIAELAGCGEEDILTTDLFLYVPDRGIQWGGYISSPRLDDLQCAFSSLEAFLNARTVGSFPVYCLFDNEEVGSRTKQGAESTFLSDVLHRTAAAVGTDLYTKLPSSFMVSCDNGHAVHPNHPELSDKNHSVHMNKGVVIKYNANQSYTSDAVSAGVFRLICQRAEVPVQVYNNRADIAGGSTLGNIASTKVSVNTVDIGLAQLAMHSAFETAGAEDTAYMVKALTGFYETEIISAGDGKFSIR